MAISLKVNGATRSVNAEPDTPLLYVLRNDLELNGAKYGCGLSQCGACTVLVDGVATRSCVTPIGKVGQAEVTTLEALGTVDETAPAPAGLHRRAGRAVRLLHQRHDHGRQGFARSQSAAERGPGARRTGRQSVPLRQPQPHRACRPARGPVEREDLIMNAPHLTRRDFTAGLGGIVLSFSLAPQLAPARQPQLPGSLNINRMLSAWLAINADGTATVMTGKVELGQGILTALGQIAAEELDLPLDAHQDRFRRHRPDPNEGRPPAAFCRKQRHGAAACRGGSARHPARPRRQEARRRGR